MTMQITMLSTRMGPSGTLLTAGSTYSVSEAYGAQMVGAGYATDPAKALQPTGLQPLRYDPTTGQAVDGAGKSFIRGPVTSDWMTIPSIFRLRLTGTGTVTIDSKDSLDNITEAVAVYTVSAATDQIEYPFAGPNAVAIRATITDTATAEVI